MKLKDLYEMESEYEILNFDDIPESYKKVLKNKKVVNLKINKDDKIRILDENFVVTPFYLPFSKELLECEVITKGVNIFSNLDVLSFKVRILKNVN